MRPGYAGVGRPDNSDLLVSLDGNDHASEYESLAIPQLIRQLPIKQRSGVVKFLDMLFDITGTPKQMKGCLIGFNEPQGVLLHASPFLKQWKAGCPGPCGVESIPALSRREGYSCGWFKSQPADEAYNVKLKDDS